MLSKGYEIVYNYSQEHLTTTSEIRKISLTCENSTILCAGGGIVGSDILNLVACGNCREITDQNLIYPVLNGLAYWYFSPEVMFGFSPNSTISGTETLSYDTFYPTDEKRLSWSLTYDYGGWRLGSITSSVGNIVYAKYMFILARFSSTTTEMTTSTIQATTTVVTTEFSTTIITTTVPAATTTSNGIYISNSQVISEILELYEATSTVPNEFTTPLAATTVPTNEFTLATTTVQTTEFTTTITTTTVPAATTTSNGIDTSNSQVMFEILQSYDGDLTSCLLNCSNNGVCYFDSLENVFKCSCDTFFVGASCQTDVRPCSLNPCINNSTCVNNQRPSGEWYFSCDCQKYYTGLHCENKINVCENETCSSNGNCYDNSNVATCKCFKLYEGQKCEKKSQKLIVIKGAIRSASIIAIVTIVAFFIFFIIMDISSCLMKKKKLSQPKRRQKKQNKV